MPYSVNHQSKQPAEDTPTEAHLQHPIGLVQQQLALLDIPTFQAPTGRRECSLLVLQENRVFRLKVEGYRHAGSVVESQGVPAQLKGASFVDFHVIARFTSNLVQDTEFYVFPRHVIKAVFESSFFKDEKVYLPMTLTRDPQYRDEAGFEQIKHHHRFPGLGLAVDSPDWLANMGSDSPFLL